MNNDYLKEQGTKDMITDMILRDIEGRGPIFRAIVRQLEKELNKRGLTYFEQHGTK